MANYNRPAIAQSTIIDLKGRPVGSEDMEQAALMLQWAEQAGFRGTDLDVAGAVAQGIRSAIEMAMRGEHEASAKQAGNCLWVLKKNREYCNAQSRHSLGSIDVPCRDGQTRKLGNMVEWFAGVHGRIHEQITTAKAAEALEDEKQANLEMEALQLAAMVTKGVSTRKAA